MVALTCHTFLHLYIIMYTLLYITEKFYSVNSRLEKDFKWLVLGGGGGGTNHLQNLVFPLYFIGIWQALTNSFTYLHNNYWLPSNQKSWQLLIGQRKHWLERDLNKWILQLMCEKGEGGGGFPLPSSVMAIKGTKALSAQFSLPGTRRWSSLGWGFPSISTRNGGGIRWGACWVCSSRTKLLASRTNGR